MSLEQLDAVYMDGNIIVPEDFTERLKADFGTLERLTADDPQHARRSRTVRFVSMAASVAVLAGIGLGIARWQNEPKDTFDDPYLAYAELEKAFARMSEGVQKGLAMAEDSEAALDKAILTFKNK